MNDSRKPPEGSERGPRRFLDETFDKESYLDDLEQARGLNPDDPEINWGTINRRPEYASDGLVTIHTCNFRHTPEFIAAKNAASTATGFDYEIDWRLHTALWVARHCSLIPGDFVECGVDKGFLSRAIVQFLDFNTIDKRFFLIDTFEGIPLEYVSEREFEINPHVNLGEGHFHGSREQAAVAFSAFDNVSIIQGKVPDVLPEIGIETVSYLSLDMNNAYPEVSAAEFFWERIVRGGMVLLDDYARNVTYEEQRKAFDEFARNVGVEVLTMATGQGLMIKP